MTFASVVQSLIAIVNATVVPILYLLAFVSFLIGMVQYFFVQSEEARTKGKNMVLYGIIGFVVIFGVWALVNIGVNTLNSFVGP